MQKEIRKRTQVYGIIAALSALVLGALCYNFGVTPIIYQSTTAPLKTFSSYADLRNFLITNTRTQYVFPYLGPLDTKFYAAETNLPSEIIDSLTYSTTNIQVAGVDEADVVKTDGEHIYLIANNSIFILKAYPPEEKVEILLKMTFNDTYLAGIFVSQDNNTLAVLGSKYSDYYTIASRYQYAYETIKTFINIYDISNKTNPVLARNFTMSGSYFNSRMVGEYVYAVISQPAYIISDTVILPKFYLGDEIIDADPLKIYYSNVVDNYFTFTTVVAINMQKTQEEPNNMTIMMGGTSNMYVSLNNIYITFPGTEQQTSIYRIHIENSTLKCEAQGKVPGYVLNQFSMDEYDENFRIATTTRMNETVQNNLYILNMNLTIIGSLENIAPGEALDSARFIGNRCYLATSIERRDPFFVIDVENASDPKILGYLKIPGFTRYLHPYDENNVIGIGRDETNNVKISIFDVSNVSAPIEISKYSVLGDGSDTSVLTEHKAFLFARSKNLVVIPLSIYNNSQPYVWQGVYVFNISLTDGIALRGNITQQGLGNEYHWYGSSDWIKRTLYIGNVLYTVSDSKVKLNSLEDLAFIKEIDLS